MKETSDWWALLTSCLIFGFWSYLVCTCVFDCMTTPTSKKNWGIFFFCILETELCNFEFPFFLFIKERSVTGNGIFAVRRTHANVCGHYVLSQFIFNLYTVDFGLWKLKHIHEVYLSFSVCQLNKLAQPDETRPWLICFEAGDLTLLWISFCFKGCFLL